MKIMSFEENMMEIISNFFPPCLRYQESNQNNQLGRRSLCYHIAHIYSKLNKTCFRKEIKQHFSLKVTFFFSSPTIPEHIDFGINKIKMVHSQQEHIPDWAKVLIYILTGYSP